MPRPSRSNDPATKKDAHSPTWLSYILRLLPAIFLLIVLPVAIVNLLEFFLPIYIESEDRSLIYFFLFIFFIAYLAIDIHKTPLGGYQKWLHRLEFQIRDYYRTFLGPKSDDDD